VDDEDPDFFPITTSNVHPTVDYSSDSNEVPIISKSNKRKYSYKNTSNVNNTNDLHNLLSPATFDQSSVTPT